MKATTVRATMHQAIIHIAQQILIDAPLLCEVDNTRDSTHR
jgi:hypothetical protein